MKKVLVAPLDWGLGHATRCVPVINQLQVRGCEVSIAGSGASLDLLRNEFPDLTSFELPGYNPVYPKRGAQMVLTMTKQVPHFFATIRKEHRVIEELERKHGFDLIISDNRYGCWSSKTPSVFITHQSNILMPKRFGWMAPLIRVLNNRLMRNFKECWVPDFADGNNLTGKLNRFAFNAEKRFKFIGPLSRFSASKRKREKLFDVTIILSGPEPQRSMLEKIIRVQVKATDLRFCLIRGVVSSSQRSIAPNIYDFLTTRKLQEVIESSEVIVARSGYSTVMDMAALRKKVIFIPTPGQTEQEYLATTLQEKGIAFAGQQDNFDLQYALVESKNYQGFKHFPSDSHLLSDAIDSILGLKRVAKIF